MNENNVLVVGGTSGIGECLVRLFVQDGYNVFATSRHKEIANPIAGVTYLAYDVESPLDDLTELPETLQALVYCPGTILLKSFARTTDEEFLRDYRINVVGAASVIRTCLKRMKKSTTGSSITMFSSVAAYVGLPLHTSIASAKAAIEGFMRSLASELAPKIRVNVIAPSLTQTPLATSLVNTVQKMNGAMLRHPLQTIGDPQDIAKFAAHIIREESKWITGQVFHLDGGLSTLK